jgi:hypothetical protein
MSLVAGVYSRGMVVDTTNSSVKMVKIADIIKYCVGANLPLLFLNIFKVLRCIVKILELYEFSFNTSKLSMANCNWGWRV